MVVYKSVALPQACVAFAEGHTVPLGLLERLVERTEWEQPSYNFSGRVVPQPRLSRWMGEPEARYRYSGRTYPPARWDPEVLELRNQLVSLLGAPFNSCLLNYYRDHHDSVSYHSDDEPELGADPFISALSLGATRVLSWRSNNGEPAVHVPLPHESLLVMSGRTQRCWKHAVPKQKKPCGPRVSLTFRHVQAGGVSSS